MTAKDLTTELLPRESLEAPAAPSWTVHVVDGPGAGAVFEVGDALARRVLVGTSPACDVRLADTTVSRRHAALEADSGGLRVVDLDSRNGTWIGAVRVREGYVNAGAVLRFGRSAIRVDTDGVLRELPVSGEASFHSVVGISTAMRVLYPLFARLGRAEVPVLIEGETGTGKELLAESLHEESGRRAGPFIVLDCTTVAPALVEGELFGWERGAFTGAESSRAGLFEQAHGGTLFLDEIGDLEIGLQAKLLRALERKEVRRVGGREWIKVDVRFIAATRRDLEREIQAQRFRDDLFYRLAVARVELPPLRKRQGDVSFLARFLWRKLGGEDPALHGDVLQRFESYEWPGNVRELANAVAQQLAMGEFRPATTREVAAVNAGDFIGGVVASGEPLPLARRRVIEELERRYVEAMLALHRGNVTRAAAASGVGRRYFQMVRAKR
jgi:DNA-binding NtrC family response regulator